MFDLEQFENSKITHIEGLCHYHNDGFKKPMQGSFAINDGELLAQFSYYGTLSSEENSTQRETYFSGLISKDGSKLTLIQFGNDQKTPRSAYILEKYDNEDYEDNIFGDYSGELFFIEKKDRKLFDELPVNYSTLERRVRKLKFLSDLSLDFHKPEFIPARSYYSF